MSVNKSHRATIRATRIVYTAEHRVLVNVQVTCSCRAVMLRRFRMHNIMWPTDVVLEAVPRWLECDDIYTSTEARARWGASRCPALVAVVRNTNAAAGVPVTPEDAVRILRGEDA